jgi:hypothetical protein
MLESYAMSQPALPTPSQNRRSTNSFTRSEWWSTLQAALRVNDTCFQILAAISCGPLRLLFSLSTKCSSSSSPSSAFLS